MGTTFNGTGNCCERQRREPLGGGGSGDMHPQKIFNSESLKIAISRTLKPIAVSKGFQKLIVIFFTLTKIALSSAVIYFHN